MDTQLIIAPRTGSPQRCLFLRVRRGRAGNLILKRSVKPPWPLHLTPAGSGNDIQDDNPNDDCDPAEPRVTYESLSLGEEQCLEVKKKIILILKLILVFIISVNFVIVIMSSSVISIPCVR